jgi:hypothetical protein
MLHLMFTACLLANMNSCQKVDVQLHKEESITACLKTAQQHVLDWQKAHTNYIVLGWECSNPANAPKPAQTSN